MIKNFPISSVAIDYPKFLISLVIFFLPFVWNFNGSIFSGGDDTQLFYFYPVEIIKNWAFYVNSNNQLGNIGYFFSQAFLIPFSLLVAFLNFLFSKNFTQPILWGLNLSLGFIYTYNLFNQLNFYKGRLKEKKYASILASFIYIFSPFFLLTIWRHSLVVPLFLNFLVPFIIYRLIEASKSKSNLTVFNTALIVFIFPIIPVSLPWVYGTILCIFPFILYLIINKLLRIKVLILFVTTLIILNIYTLGPTLMSFYIDKSNLLSGDIPANNVSQFSSILDNLSLIYPMIGLPMSRWYRAYSTFGYNFIQLISASIISIIFYSGYFLDKNNQFFKVLMISFLVSCFFYTGSILNIGTEGFDFLNRNLPGFIMMRNNFDKVVFGYVLIYSLILYFSIFNILINIKYKLYKILILLILSLSILVLSQPLILGGFNSILQTKEKPIKSRLVQFNVDFIELSKYLSNLRDNNRILWLPLNLASYIYISDKYYSDYYYIGPSPLQFLSSKQDLTGRFSFPHNIDFMKSARNLLIDKNNDFIQMVNYSGIKYIVVNNDLNNEILNSGLYSINNNADFYLKQKKNVYPLLLGDKIKDFGFNYSLYLMNPQISSDRFKVNTNVQNRFITGDSYFGVEYIVNLKGGLKFLDIVLLENYSSSYKISCLKPKIDISNMFLHKPFQGYANKWILKKELNLSDVCETNSDDSFTIIINDKYVNFYFAFYFLTILSLFLILLLNIRFYFKKNEQ